MQVSYCEPVKVDSLPNDQAFMCSWKRQNNATLPVISCMLSYIRHTNKEIPLVHRFAACTHHIPFRYVNTISTYGRGSRERHIQRISGRDKLAWWILWEYLHLLILLDSMNLYYDCNISEKPSSFRKRFLELNDNHIGYNTSIQQKFFRSFWTTHIY